MLASLASALWLGQAACIAWALTAMFDQPSPASPVVLAAAFFALTGLRAGLDWIAQGMLARASDAQIQRLRSAIVTAEAKASAPSGFGGPGALAALASDKLEALRPYHLRYRPARMQSAVMPVLILGIALWHSWALALVFVVAGPLIPLFMALVGWAAKSASEKQMGEISQLNDLLADRLAALSDMRLAGIGDRAAEEFATASDRLRERTMAVLKIAFLSSTVLELFAALGVAMVAVWVGFSLLGEIAWGTWGTAITPFAGMYLLLLAPEFFQPLRNLAAAWHDKAAADAVLKDIGIWQDEARGQILGAENTGTSSPISAPLRWSGLQALRGGRVIAYPDMTLPAGTRLAITGPSGSGKSTLLRLLAGLDLAEAGTIAMGRTPLDDASADAWRDVIGWMPQAPHFLAQSLRHNIAFGTPIDSALLAQAQLPAVLNALPKGLDTRLGERGAGLSGGEARRVTLARALHARPLVVLADEPTADLDAQTAEAITAGLLQFAKDGGILIIATHDPNLMAQMDQQITLPAQQEDAA